MIFAYSLQVHKYMAYVGIPDSENRQPVHIHEIFREQEKTDIYIICTKENTKS